MNDFLLHSPFLLVAAMSLSLDRKMVLSKLLLDSTSYGMEVWLFLTAFQQNGQSPFQWMNLYWFCAVQCGCPRQKMMEKILLWDSTSMVHEMHLVRTCTSFPQSKQLGMASLYCWLWLQNVFIMTEKMLHNAAVLLRYKAWLWDVWGSMVTLYFPKFQAS